MNSCFNVLAVLFKPMTQLHSADTVQFAHGLRMYRTLALNPAEFASQGLPTCKFCNRSFRTWQSFHTHVQRGCQAVLLGPQPCTRDSELTALAAAGVRTAMTDLATRGTAQLTTSDLRLLLNEEWGDRVLAMIHNQTLHLLEHEQAACHFLSKRCALCGIHFSRTQEVHQHYQTVHPTVWPDVPQKQSCLRMSIVVTRHVHIAAVVSGHIDARSGLRLRHWS